MSNLQKTRLQAQLDSYDLQIKDILERIKVARDMGDLKENSEYEQNMNIYNMLSAQRLDCEQKLNEAEVIDNADSPLITIGSLVRVSHRDSSRIFLVEESGSSTLEGILGVGSALGSAILGKSSGKYNIQNPHGEMLVYNVIKLPSTEEHLQGYLQTYPDVHKYLNEYFSVS